ncbi:MAG: hypothetical protein Q9214_002341 [Letrouitia sp. 1 TL-2023]
MPLATPPEMEKDQAITDQESSGSVAADEEPQLQLASQGDRELHLSPSSDDTDDVVPTTKLQFLVIFVALILAIFCVALDNTIIVTAIPRITDTYKALSDVGWYGSAFNLPAAALIPFFGKIYAISSTKVTFLVALFIFEVGSLISAVAPNSIAFIVGRALSGAGSAGIFNGALVTITMISPLDKRPAYQSVIGGTYAIATITAPLIGGAFTDSISWRWCFYINLPIGGLAAAMLVFVLHLPSPPRPQQTWMQILWSLDPLGQMLFLPSIICVLIALQWAGTEYAWSNARVIVLMVFFVILLVAFIINELWMGPKATIPPNVASQRTVAAASCFAFFNYAQFFIFVYFIPIYFQAIKGVDAEQSGIDTIPLIVANNVASLTSGILTTKFGTYVQYFYGCSILTSIGGGLITTWQVDSPHSKWIGYQIISGFGTGLALALPQVAVQPGLSPQEIPIGISMTIFFQFFGGAIFVSIGNNILNSKLVQYVGDINIPNYDASKVVQAGATELRRAIPDGYLPRVLIAYNEALRLVFRAGLAMACLSVLAALPLEWRSMKPTKESEGKRTEKSDDALVMAA